MTRCTLSKTKRNVAVCHTKKKDEMSDDTLHFVKDKTKLCSLSHKKTDEMSDDFCAVCQRQQYGAVDHVAKLAPSQGAFPVGQGVGGFCVT